MNNLEAVERIGATVVLKQHGTEIYFCNDDVYKLPIGTLLWLQVVWVIHLRA